MAKIISFKEAEKNLKLGDLTNLLKKASLIRGRDSILRDKIGIVAVKEGQLRGVFEKEITDEIFNQKLVSSDVLLCGIYVSNLLAELAVKTPESWWAIDYTAMDDSIMVRKGGDICFAICGVFPERGNYRVMKIPYYHKMGATFYRQFYELTGKEIGYHMSRRFDEMAHVAQRCIGRL
ncbi:MAG: hypothetical protein WC461_00715 [Candidatus Paceibacterota bacterium]